MTAIFDQDESVYDPRSNPRYSVDEEVEQDDDFIDRDEAETKLRVAVEVEQVFMHKGWKHLEATLTQEMDLAINAIIQGSVTDPVRIAEKRSRATTLKQLLEMPKENKERIATLRQYLADDEQASD